VVSDFQGHPRLMILFRLTRRMPLPINSNLSRIFHRFRDMASFPLKNAHFSYLTPFNFQYENVSQFALDGWKFACYTHG